MFPRLVFPKYYCLSGGDASVLNHLGFQFVFEFLPNSKIKRRAMGIKVTAFIHLAFCTFPLANFITLASRIFQLATFIYLTFCILVSTAFINLAFHIFLLGTFTHLVQPIFLFFFMMSWIWLCLNFNPFSYLLCLGSFMLL